MSQQQKVWFITGCSTGFGRHIAKHAIDAGYKVVVIARNVEQIQDITAGYQENTLTLPLDVTNQEQINSAVPKTIQKFWPH